MIDSRISSVSASISPLPASNSIETSQTTKPSLNDADILLKKQIENDKSVTLISDALARDVKLDEKQKARVEENKPLLNAIDTVSSFMNHPIKNVNFLVDDSSGKMVIRVVDAKSQDLIKQFPSEKILEMAEKVKGLQKEIGEKTGIFIDSKI